MRTYARLEALKQWAYDTVCKGRRMKAEPPDRKITYWQEPVEPAVHIANFPKRYDETNMHKLPVRMGNRSQTVGSPSASKTQSSLPSRMVNQMEKASNARFRIICRKPLFPAFIFLLNSLVSITL